MEEKYLKDVELCYRKIDKSRLIYKIRELTPGFIMERLEKRL